MEADKAKDGIGYVLVVFDELEPVATTISMDATHSMDDVAEAVTKAIAEAVYADKPNATGEGRGIPRTLDPVVGSLDGDK